MATASTPTHSLTQHPYDARLGADAAINIVAATRQRLEQTAALQLDPDEHVQHTDGRHRPAKEQKAGHGEDMCKKVVIHLSKSNDNVMRCISISLGLTNIYMCKQQRD